MAPIKLSDLPDDPAGPNLEFDPAFVELERLSQGKPEQQYGDTVIAPEEPDWKAIESAALALLERTHDLRLLTHLAVARLQRGGLSGFVDTLEQIRFLLEQRWSAVHPQLDPEDDNDPTLRANALLSLGGHARVLRALRTMPLARSPRAGTVSWYDVNLSNRTIEAPEGVPVLTDGVIAGAFRDSDPAELAALRDRLRRALADVAAIPAAFDVNAGFGTGPDYTALTKLLNEMVAIMDTRAPAGPTQPVEDDAPRADKAVDAGAPPSPPTAPAFSIANMPPPTNRADALRLLELVMEFYEKQEPSSPLPLLIARARRLAEMSFMDIMRDLAPDGVSQVERVTGKPD